MTWFGLDASQLAHDFYVPLIVTAVGWIVRKTCAKVSDTFDNLATKDFVMEQLAEHRQMMNETQLIQHEANIRRFEAIEDKISWVRADTKDARQEVKDEAEARQQTAEHPRHHQH